MHEQANKIEIKEKASVETHNNNSLKKTQKILKMKINKRKINLKTMKTRKIHHQITKPMKNQLKKLNIPNTSPN